MNDTNTSTVGAAPDRPTLLTVICIISFIMGVWGVIGGIKGITKDPVAEKAKLDKIMAEQMAKIGDNATAMTTRWMDAGHEIGLKSIEQAKPMGIASIVISLISLLGVWMMWNLRKTGFWFYLLATIGGLAVPLVYLGGSVIALLSVGFVGLFSIVFIILYAVNLKHMH